jgi:hypothetical protein
MHYTILQALFPEDGRILVILDNSAGKELKVKRENVSLCAAVKSGFLSSQGKSNVKVCLCMCMCVYLYMCALARAEICLFVHRLTFLSGKSNANACVSVCLCMYMYVLASAKMCLFVQWSNQDFFPHKEIQCKGLLCVCVCLYMYMYVLASANMCVCVLKYVL